MKTKTTANERRVAECLGTERVCKASDLAYGTGNYIKRNDGNTTFSREAYTEVVKAYPRSFPKYVVKFVKANPRVQIVCYSTNTRKLNRILTTLDLGVRP